MCFAFSCFNCWKFNLYIPCGNILCIFNVSLIILKVFFILAKLHFYGFKNITNENLNVISTEAAVKNCIHNHYKAKLIHKHENNCD